MATYVHHKCPNNKCWNHQQKVVRRLLYSESKGVAQDGVKELLVDDEFGADDPPGYYQEAHYLDKSR